MWGPGPKLVYDTLGETSKVRGWHATWTHLPWCRKKRWGSCLLSRSLPGERKAGTSLVVQWVSLHTPNAGDLGLIPGRGTRSSMQQLRPGEAKINKLTKKINKIFGLPWWRSGWESTCQCRGHGFEPWPGRIPYAAEQLGPCATTAEPVL